MSHISGLIATGEAASPFPYCDIVTSTTHKSLRGPRSGIIFFNKGKYPELETKINEAVFPQMQGGPHNHQIAALATQLLQVQSPEFKVYTAQVRKNSNVVAKYLISKGYKLMTGGTDNHMILWDLRPLKLTGSKFETLAEGVRISMSKNLLSGDKS